MTRPWSLGMSDEALDKLRAEEQSRSSSRPQSVLLQQSWSHAPIEAVPPVNFERYRHSVIGLNQEEAQPDPASDDVVNQGHVNDEHETAKTSEMPEDRDEESHVEASTAQVHSVAEHDLDNHAASTTELGLSEKTQPADAVVEHVAPSVTTLAETSTVLAPESPIVENNRAAMEPAAKSSSEDLAKSDKHARRASDITTLPSQLRALALSKQSFESRSEMGMVDTPVPDHVGSGTSSSSVSKYSSEPVSSRLSTLERPHELLASQMQTNALTIEEKPAASDIDVVSSSLTTAVEPSTMASLPSQQHVRDTNIVVEQSAMDEDASASTRTNRQAEPDQGRSPPVEDRLIYSSDQNGRKAPPKDGVLAQESTAVPWQEPRETSFDMPAVPASRRPMVIKRKPSGPSYHVSHDRWAESRTPTSNGGAETPLEEKLDRALATSTFAIDLDTLGMPRNNELMKQHPALRDLPAQNMPDLKRAEASVVPVKEDSPKRKSAALVPSTRDITDQFGIEDVDGASLLDDPAIEKSSSPRSRKRRSSVWENIKRARTSSEHGAKESRAAEHKTRGEVPNEAELQPLHKSNVQQKVPVEHKVKTKMPSEAERGPLPKINSQRNANEQHKVETKKPRETVLRTTLRPNKQQRVTEEHETRAGKLDEAGQEPRPKIREQARIAEEPRTKAEKPNQAEFQRQPKVNEQEVTAAAPDVADSGRKRFSGLGSLFGRTRPQDIKPSKSAKLSKRTSMRQSMPSSTDLLQPTLPRINDDARPDYATYEATRKRHSEMYDTHHKDQHQPKNWNHSLDRGNASSLARPPADPVVFEPGHAWYNHFFHSTHQRPDLSAQQYSTPSFYQHTVGTTPFKPSEPTDELAYHKVRGHGLETDLDREPGDLAVGQPPQPNRHLPSTTPDRKHRYSATVPQRDNGITTSDHSSAPASHRSDTKQSWSSRQQTQPQAYAIRGDAPFQADFDTAQPAYVQRSILVDSAQHVQHANFASDGRDHADTEYHSAFPDRSPHPNQNQAAGFDFGFNSPQRYSSGYEVEEDLSYRQSSPDWRHNESPHRMRGVSYPGQEWVPTKG